MWSMFKLSGPVAMEVPELSIALRTRLGEKGRKELSRGCVLRMRLRWFRPAGSL